MKIPIEIYLDLRQRIEDTMHHELHFGVVGSKASATIAVVESDFYSKPRIIEIEKDGLNVLGADLRDRFLVILFRLAVAEMRAQDGSAIEWTISNLSRFLERQFSAADVAAISSVLSNFVSPELEVRDVARTRID